MAARVGRSGWRTDKKNDGNDMNDARKVAPGIEPGLPESESGVITITLHNQRTLHIESYKYIEYNKFSEVQTSAYGDWSVSCQVVVSLDLPLNPTSYRSCPNADFQLSKPISIIWTGKL